MAEIKDRVKGAIDTGAEKAKGFTDQAAGAAKEAAAKAQQQAGNYMESARDRAQIGPG